MIILPHTPKQRPQLPFTIGFGSADGLLYPPVDGQMFPLAEVIDFKPLILNSLFVAADPNVAVIHSSLPPLSFRLTRIRILRPAERNRSRSDARPKDSQCPQQFQAL